MAERKLAEERPGDAKQQKGKAEQNRYTGYSAFNLIFAFPAKCFDIVKFREQRRCDFRLGKLAIPRD